MEQSGEYRFAAGRQAVWDALVDEEVIETCIPGCEGLIPQGPHRYTSKVKARVGPLSATFGANIWLEEMNPPDNYKLHAEVKGAGGFGYAEARVELTELDDDNTHLRYVVAVRIGGGLAAIGQRLVGGAINRLMADFFAAFHDVMDERG